MVPSDYIQKQYCSLMFLFATCFSDCAPKTPTKVAQDDSVATKLWEVSAKLTGVS